MLCARLAASTRHPSSAIKAQLIVRSVTFLSWWDRRHTAACGACVSTSTNHRLQPRYHDFLITSAAADACTTAQATQQTLSSDLFLPADGFRDTALGISVLMKRTMSAAMAPPLPRASLHFRHCPLKF